MSVYLIQLESCNLDNIRIFFISEGDVIYDI